MGAQIMQSREEFLLGIGQRSSDAAVKDVRVLLKMEECVLSMGQHGQRDDAAVMDAQTKLRMEECA
jgi:hypothetical protein